MEVKGLSKYYSIWSLETSSPGVLFVGQELIDPTGGVYLEDSQSDLSSFYSGQTKSFLALTSQNFTQDGDKLYIAIDPSRAEDKQDILYTLTKYFSSKFDSVDQIRPERKKTRVSCLFPK